MAKIAKEASRTIDDCYIHTSIGPLYSEAGFWLLYPPKKSPTLAFIVAGSLGWKERWSVFLLNMMRSEMGLSGELVC